MHLMYGRSDLVGFNDKRTKMNVVMGRYALAPNAFLAIAFDCGGEAKMNSNLNADALRRY